MRELPYGEEKFQAGRYKGQSEMLKMGLVLVVVGSALLVFGAFVTGRSTVESKFFNFMEDTYDLVIGIERNTQYLQNKKGNCNENKRKK